MTNKIDSNFTGLRYTEEADIGVLPAAPVWNLLEPNSYGDFGAQITTLARTPILPGRQRKKGVITDLDATAAFQTDFTQDNFRDLLQGFMFADWRKVPEQAASAAVGAATDAYTVPSGRGFVPGHQVLVSGFVTSANNGIKTVEAVTHGDVAEAVLSVTNTTAADGETLTLGVLSGAAKVYTLRAALTSGGAANDVLIGATTDTMIANLAAAINGGDGEGVTYGLGTVAHPDMLALSDTGVDNLILRAKDEGALYNAVTVADTLTNSAFDGAATTLLGGTDASIAVTTDLTDETAVGQVKVVGYKFPVGGLAVNQVSVTESQLVQQAAVLAAATEDLVISAITNLNNETVSVGTLAGLPVVYTYKTALTGTGGAPYEVLIGADLAAAVNNLAAAINGGAGAGTTYGLGTVAHPDVAAVSDGTDTVTATAVVAGEAGNAITVADDLTDGEWGTAATVLSGGVGASWAALGFIPGKWLFVGGDSAGAAGDQFATAGNNGFKRVYAVTSDSILTIDKTQGAMADEAAGTLLVALYFGDAVKNEAEPDLIVRRSYQLERSLVSAGYEYVLGCVANTMAINAQTANKITVDVGFVATDSEQLGATARKAGTFPSGAASLAEQADAFNTSSDFARLRLARGDAPQTPLFAFLEEIALNVNNNVTPNKAISVLGAFDLTAGDFAVEGSMTAYFADVAAVAAVRENADVTLDFSFAKANKGWLFDIPLLTLGDARLNVEKDQAIRLPLTVSGAAHPVFNHTLLVQVFDYLPDAA
jgi:hypothetical protein